MYAIFVAKMLVISENKRAPTREQRYPHWVLPVAGGALATTLLVLWLTSSPLVLHERAVRAVRRRPWRPLTVLVGVAGAVFALAKGRLLAPAGPTGAGAAASIEPGDAYQGEIVFVGHCAGCHGDGGSGGGVGPRLAGAGL